MIDLRPDPAHPRGGYAELSVEAASLPDESVSLEVYDLYGERYLGAKGWQPERHAFGPYAVTREAVRASIIIGPEVVDRVEEFSALRVSLGPITADLSWPDDIVHSPKAATSDRAIKVGSAPEIAPGPAPIRMAEPETPPVPTPEPDPAPTPDPDPDPPEAVATETEDKPASKLPLILGGLAVLVVGAIAAFFLLQGEEVVETAPPEPAPVTPVAPPPVAALPDPCGPEALAALGGQGFVAIADGLRGCGGSVTPDTALGLLEGAVAANDPQALAFFGTLYDPSRTDPVIEDQIGLTLGDNPARAAEYYARARDAGAAEAAEYLASICLTLTLKTDTLSVSAREDHCAN